MRECCDGWWARSRTSSTCARCARARSRSDVLFAEVTIGVEGATTVEQAHHIADTVEEKISKELGVAEVLVHVEPA